jgi:hypothetical protein
MTKKDPMNLFRIVSFLILAFYIYSCKENENNFTVGQELINISSDIIISDTSSLRFYTIKSDSTLTSGQQALLAGHYKDDIFGSITASSFTQIGLANSMVLDNNKAVFDSISLILHYSGIYYGDTTLPFHIEIRKLTESLKIEESDVRYNNSKVSYDTLTALGKTMFYPKPRRNKDINITLSDAFGVELFNLIKLQQENDIEQLSSLDGFLNYFQGIALIPGKDAVSSSILRFSGADSSVRMRLYFHEGKTTRYFDFPNINPTLQFNRITDDLSQTRYPLNTLQKAEDRLLSLQSANQTFIQGGTGFLTRIEFPYLSNFKFSSNRIKLLKAQLIIRPVKNTYKTFTLPTKFVIYEANFDNKIGYIQNDTTASQLTIDDLYNEETAYTIDISSFINSAIQNTTDDIPAIIVTLPFSDSRSTLKRAILSDGMGQNISTKLKILYWRY